MKTYLIAAIIFIAIAWFGWSSISGLVQQTKNDLTGPVNAIEEIFDRI